MPNTLTDDLRALLTNIYHQLENQSIRLARMETRLVGLMLHSGMQSDGYNITGKGDSHGKSQGQGTM